MDHQEESENEGESDFDEEETLALGPRGDMPHPHREGADSDADAGGEVPNYDNDINIDVEEHVQNAFVNAGDIMDQVRVQQGQEQGKLLNLHNFHLCSVSVFYSVNDSTVNYLTISNDSIPINVHFNHFLIFNDL